MCSPEILDITSGLPGIISVTGGTCHFHEKNNFATFSHGFSIDFENHNAREEFMLNPITLPIKSRIVDIADGGHAGIVGFDFGSAQG